MLILVRSFSYTPDASVNEFVLQSSLMLVLVRSFSTDHSEDVLKHFACWIGENLLLH